MKPMTIRIEAVATGGYQVSLFEGAPPGPVAAQSIAQATRPAIEADDLRKEVLERSGDAEDIGVKLGKFLVDGAVGEAWNQTSKDSGTLRTYLDIPDRDLHAIPWEFARSDESALFLDVRLPFCIFRSPAPPARDPEWGIRVLVVIAAQDADDQIGTWREVYGIRNAIRPVNRIIDLCPLRWPSRDQLREKIQEWQPHVLHVIGHGDNRGLLLFDGANLVPWGALQVKNDLDSWKWKPEVVYLNTCRSAGGQLSMADQGRQWTVVDRFLENGVSAVIAMQADVQGRLAGVCAGEFYRSIAAADPIDVALARGRQAIARLGQEANLDPYLPKLIVTRPVEEILRYTAQLNLAECPELKAPLETFVDRDDKRRELVDLLERGRPVVLVKGPQDVGKTWLLQWGIDAWRRRQMNVRYIPISGCRTWLDVVRLIRDGNPDYANNPASVLRGLGPGPRAILNWRLNALARGIADPPADTFTGAEEEEPGRLQSLVEPPLTIIEPHVKAMAALHAALQMAADNLPLIIVLDNFAAGDQGLTEMHFAVLQKYWIESLVVRPGASNIRVVLGLSSAQIKDYNLEVLPAGYSDVNLGYFPKEDFGDIILDLMPLVYQLGPDRDKALNWVRKEMVNYDPEFEGQLSGPLLRERCRDIWKFCQAMRKEWAKEP